MVTTRHRNSESHVLALHVKDIVTVVGRLCLDPEADAVASSSKLSPTTLVLESSRMGGSGERVPLKFEPDFSIRGAQDANAEKSLFPGEILALRGRNGGGGWFSVKEILPVSSSVLKSAAYHGLTSLLRYHQSPPPLRCLLYHSQCQSQVVRIPPTRILISNHFEPLSKRSRILVHPFYSSYVIYLSFHSFNIIIKRTLLAWSLHRRNSCFREGIQVYYVTSSPLSAGFSESYNISHTA
jgi:DNA polymerase alpha subunit B, OB domain